MVQANLGRLGVMCAWLLPTASLQVLAFILVLMVGDSSRLSFLARDNGRVSPDPSGFCSTAPATFQISMLNGIRMKMVQH